MRWLMVLRCALKPSLPISPVANSGLKNATAHGFLQQTGLAVQAAKVFMWRVTVQALPVPMLRKFVDHWPRLHCSATWACRLTKARNAGFSQSSIISIASA
ncbi:hypothetical protein D3C80_1841670 [compost metagenome]